MIHTPMGHAMQVAMSQYGISEWTGIEHNPEVMKYYHDIGHDWVRDDETAWCAAFANWVLKVSGFAWQSTLNAKSFLDLGTAIPLEQAQSGDIIVLERGKPGDPYGHVGFLSHYDENAIYLLGGNQGNQVNVTGYSRQKFISAQRVEPDPFFTDRRAQVYEAINSERTYQDMRWNEETTETGGKHSVTEWLVYARDYIEEALHFLSRDPDPQATRKAKHWVRKIAAICVACMEQNGAPMRDISDVNKTKST